jgi:hypothetical protein
MWIHERYNNWFCFLYDVQEYKIQEEFNKDKQKHFSLISKYLENTNTISWLKMLECLKHQFVIRINLDSLM